jgi:hypothetical protein
MSVNVSDLHLLSQGMPPESDELLRAITIGREQWVDYIRERYLQNYIARGGSKVKLLVGENGTGKTHLLKLVLADAKELNYQTVYLSARSCRLNDLPSLYREIAEKCIGEQFIRSLCRQIAQRISKTDYDGSRVFSPYIYTYYPSNKMAEDKIWQETGRFFRNTDLNSSFKAFGYVVANNRMINPSPTNIEIACDWMKGLPADDETSRRRRELYLYGKLNKDNSRDWLNSLILLCKLAGYSGLVIAIDDLEVIMEKSNGKYIFTRNQALDVCELVRQLIDDTELLSGCMFLLSGRKSIIQDDSRSFRSYDALWARLQSGLADYEKFNPFTDLVDVDKHLASNDRFLVNIFERIRDTVAGQEIETTTTPEIRASASELRKMVIDAVCSTAR